MITETVKLAKRNLDVSDLSMDCGHGTVDMVTVDEVTVGRFTLQPGWKWSEHIRPMVHTESCQMHHLQYVVSGHLRVVQEDGTETDLDPGDFASIPPGHDAWVLGDEPFVAIDFSPDLRRVFERAP
ncbi:MAG: cupin domain-containing protein [Planctomycetaceae bacterium]|nr:cupin domain-containing protein [Planctomycetaceae bacterium]